MRALILIVLIQCLFKQGLVFGSSSEFKLQNMLFSDYDTSVRPVNVFNDTLVFRLDFSLNQLIDLREKEQDMTLGIWMRWHWTDPTLAWNSTDHDGIEFIFVKPDRLWLPDITLFNSVASKDIGWPKHYKAKIESDGSVLWPFPAVIEASCTIDVTYFPFDTQKCDLIFASWGYHGNILDVFPFKDGADLKNFAGHTGWELIGVPVRREVSYFQCCPDPFPLLKYTVILKRLPLYYTFNLLLPCIIVTVINVLTFLLPVDSGEKVGLNITVLLTMMVFLLIVSDIMPPQSEVIPVIGLYFGGCIFLLSFSVLCTVFVIHLHFRGSRGQPVPACLKRGLFNWMGKLFLYGNTLKSTGFIERVEPKYKANGNVGPEEVNAVAYNAPEVGQESSAQDGIEEEWHVVALIVDRLFFVLFLVGTTIVSVYILTHVSTNEAL